MKQFHKWSLPPSLLQPLMSKWSRTALPQPPLCFKYICTQTHLHFNTFSLKYKSISMHLHPNTYSLWYSFSKIHFNCHQNVSHLNCSTIMHKQASFISFAMPYICSTIKKQKQIIFPLLLQLLCEYNCSRTDCKLQHWVQPSPALIALSLQCTCVSPKMQCNVLVCPQNATSHPLTKMHLWSSPEHN